MSEDGIRYVIIGSGVAGISAAEAIRSQDVGGHILLVSEDPHGYYSRPGLAYYLTGEVEERFLFPYQEADFARLGIKRMLARVEAVDPAAHQVLLADGRRLPYDRLLLAPGAQAAIPDTPGLDLEGVVKLDHLEDSRRILRFARSARQAVVIGGGITALEIVEGLVARGVEVHYFLRGEHIWSNVLDESESLNVEGRLAEEGVHLHKHTELAEAIGKNGRLTGAVTRDGRFIPAGLLAVAIGIQPRVELARQAGLRIGKGIQADETLKTSAADIFAAGDAAEVIDPEGNSVMNTLWTPARLQGWTAGVNMAGGSARYKRLPAFNVTRLAGLTTTIIGSVGGGQNLDLVGIARGDSETWRQIPDAIVAQKDFNINRLRVLVGERTLVGAVVMGDQTLSQPIQHLVSARVDITPIRDQLLTSQDRLGDTLAAFWSDWKRQTQPAPGGPA